MIEKVVRVTTHDDQAREDKAFWLAQTPEYRLEVLEQLRSEADRFLYEHPTRLQRTVSVTRKASR